MLQGWKVVIEHLVVALELSGAVVIAAGIIVAGIRLLLVRPEARTGRYQRCRRDVARSILLGLEVLVAADIIGTVSVSPTLESVLVLGLVVLIRTFLSISIEVEVEGRFPWMRPGSASSAP